MRETRITQKNVYTSERMQKGDSGRRRRRTDEQTAKKEEEERTKNVAERIKTVMEQHPTFAKIVSEDAALDKYLKAHPNLTKTQMRDLLDKRPDSVKVRGRTSMAFGGPPIARDGLR